MKKHPTWNIEMELLPQVGVQRRVGFHIIYNYALRKLMVVNEKQRYIYCSATCPTTECKYDIGKGERVTCSECVFSQKERLFKNITFLANIKEYKK